MKIFKKRFVLSLIPLFLFFLVACYNTNHSDGETDQNQETVNHEVSLDPEENGSLPPMTTDEITLTYASWENPYMMEYLAEQFMDQYPNMTVEVIHLDLGGYNESLLNLANAGQLPDVFWYLGDVNIPLENRWLGDMTAFFEADPENESLPNSLKAAGVFGDKRLSAPSKVLPFAIFLDQSLFERMNVPMPATNWTYSEMIDLARQMTFPEQQIFGMNLFTQLITIAPIVNQDAIGEFGWDGESFDFSAFAQAYDEQQEFARTNIFPPPVGTEENALVFGDADIWAASTGQLAMQVDAIWTASLFEEPEFMDKGINFIIYPVPFGHEALTDHKPAYIDFGGISSITEHPREAYELLKWMGWGSVGWSHKIEAFATLEYEDGSPVYTYPDGVPILNQEETWESYKALVPQTEQWLAYLDSVRSPIPMGGTYIPGFEKFLQWMGEQDIWGQLDRGELNIFDIEEHLTENANEFVRESTEYVLSLYGQ